jgi:hypothetical protein
MNGVWGVLKNSQEQRKYDFFNYFVFESLTYFGVFRKRAQFVELCIKRELYQINTNVVLVVVTQE